MLLSAHKELKNSIIALPPKEKDKLLLRLVAKDKVLTEHLHFKLLEDESGLQHRRELLEQEIDESIESLNSNRKSTSKDTLLVMRRLNGMINHHFKVTRDVNTEVELRLHLLNNLPVQLKDSVYSAISAYNDKLISYFVRTTLSAYKKYIKMHEDLQFDLSEQFNSVLAKVNQGRMANAAKELGLPQEL
jgi:hypothetical protein